VALGLTEAQGRHRYSVELAPRDACLVDIDHDRGDAPTVRCRPDDIAIAGDVSVVAKGLPARREGIAQTEAVV